MSKWPTVDERMNMSSEELEDLRVNEINKIMANTPNELSYKRLRKLQESTDSLIAEARANKSTSLEITAMIIAEMNVKRDNLLKFEEIIDLDTYKEMLTDLQNDLDKLK